MNRPELQVLLVEDNPADALFLREALAQDVLATFSLTVVESLGDALEYLTAHTFAAVLLDLGLPDSQGLSSFRSLHRAAPEVPVVVLSALDDEEVAVQALQAGAQDYLVKRPQDFPIAARAVRYAVERNKLQETLQGSEQRFSRLFHSNPTPVGITSAADYHIVDVNDAWVSLTGYAREEAIGKTSVELGLTRPEALQQIRTVLANEGKVRQLEIPLYTRAGEERRILISSESIELRGRSYLLNSLMDITERKRVEEMLRETEDRLEMVMEGSQLGYWDWNIETGDVHRNARWAEMLGYTLEEIQFTVKQWTDLHHPDDREAAWKSIQDHLEGRTPAHRIEYRMRTKDGRYKWILDQAKVVKRDLHGRPLRMSGTHTDITERRQAEEKRRESEVLLRQVLESSPDSTFALDRDYRLLINNQRHRQELVASGGRPVKAGKQILFPDYPLEIPDFWRNAYERTLTGETFSVEGSWVDIEGRSHVHENRFSPLRDAKGTIIGILVVAHDITARKEVEETLREREELLSMMGRTARVGGWDFDVATGEGHWTEEVARIHDLDPAAQPTRESGLSFYAGESKKQIATAVQDATKHAIPYDLELELVSATGNHRWVRTIGHPVIENGRVVKIRGSFQDITERKQAETLLKQRLEDLALINKLNDAVNHGEGLDQVTELLASETRKIFRSQYASVYLIHPETQTLVLERYTMPQDLIAKLEKVLGREIPQVHIPIGGDDHFNQVLNSDQGLLITGSEAIMHWLADFTNTSFLPAQVRPVIRRLIPGAVKLLNIESVISIPLKSGNETLGLIEFVTENKFDEGTLDRLQNVRHQLAEVIVRRRTEQSLRESNEKYRLLSEELEERVRQRTAEVQDLYDNAPAGYHSLDTHGNFIEVNQTQLNWSGYTRDEMLGHSFGEFLTAESRLVFEREFPIFKTRGFVHDMEFEMVRKDGPSYPVLVNATAIYDADGSFVMSRSTVFDNTERRHAEQAVREREVQLRLSRDKLSAANAALEQAARIKDEFLANMSHELRTPLTGILGLSEAMQLNAYGPLTERQDRAVRNIEQSGRHLLDLINDILDLSKIEAGMLELDIEPVALSDVCQASLLLTNGMAHQKQLTVRFSMEPPTIRVRADARRLKQILVNLLSNAIKFTPENGSLGLEVQADERAQTVRLTVWDKGIGIAPENLEQLFQPFVQLDGSLARQYEGTGLGLSLVQRMAELHGGSVHVESALGEGSRFTVLLPWIPEVQLPIRSMHRNSTSLRNALIVEDIEIDAEQLTRYLQILGMEVTVYNVGQGATERAARVQPDVILLDLHLPDRSGLDVLAELKANPATRNIPVLFCSVEERRSQAMSLGAAGYLIKPLSLAELGDEISKVADALEQHRAADPSPGAGQPQVLIVDDNELVIDLISDFLDSQNYRVAAARSGVELLEVVSTIHPDIILMDIQMPVMDGLEATRRIRAHPDPQVARVPVIALTALAMTGDRERCLAAGANEYMSKPVELKQLVVTIRNWVERR